MKPTLAIDMIGARMAGAAMVAREVLGAARRCPRIGNVHVFSPSSFEDSEITNRVVQYCHLWFYRKTRSIRKVTWLFSGFSRAMDRCHADVGLCLGNGGIADGQIPICVFVHQSLPFSKEALARCPVSLQFRMAVIKQVMAISCRRADLVAVQTEAVAELLSREFEIPRRRIKVFTPGAPDFLDEATVAPPASVGAALYVGNTLGYKNLLSLEAAFRIVKSKRSEYRMTWIILPGSTPPGDRRIDYLSGIERAKIGAAYRVAKVLVMPSLVETVGLPMLEAMRMGCPVAAADRPYAREICGDAAVYFNPLVPEDIADTLIRLDEDDDLRRELIRKGREREASLAAAKPYDRLIDDLVMLAEDRKAR